MKQFLNQKFNYYDIKFYNNKSNKIKTVHLQINQSNTGSKQGIGSNISII